MPYLEVFKIRPGETRTLTLDFSDKLPTGLGFAASGHSVAAVNHYSGSNASILASGVTVSGTDVSVVVYSVGWRERYDVTFTLKMDDATPSYVVEKVIVLGVDVL
jgi:hypothetical protein